MTKEELEHEANGLLAAAKATVELQGDFPFSILIHLKGWVRLPLPQECLALLNDGHAKDMLFQSVRDTVRDTAADAVIFGSDTWHAVTTPEGEKHYDTPEWKELHNAGFVKLLQRGWVKRYEAFTITAQTATDALLITQNYQRLGSGTIQLLDGRRDWYDQSDFGGRHKMFGDLSWQNLGSEAAVKGTPPQ